MYINQTQVNDMIFILQRIENLENKFQSLQIEHQNMKSRLTYLEYDLHPENQRLSDKNTNFRQEVDYSSEDYCTNEDSWQHEH
jgi:hypothetical protein